MEKLETPALSWMHRLTLKQTNGHPTRLEGRHCPICEIGGSLLPHISGMDGRLSQTSRGNKSPKNAIVVKVCSVPYRKTNQWRAPCPTDGCTKPSVRGPVFLHEECILLNWKPRFRLSSWSLTPSSISTAREGVYPTAWKVAIYPREGRILYTVGIHHLSIILFNGPTVVHCLVSEATGVGLFKKAPRNAVAKSQAK